MKLYKYTDEGGIAILENLTVKASLASQFNDPFELAPSIDPGQFSRRRIRKALLRRERIEERYQRLRASGTAGRKSDFKKFYRESVPSQVDAVLKELPDNVEFVRRKFAEMFSKHWRIFCVSRVSDSILMWSHYADDHRGMVIEFDASHPGLKSWSDDSRFDVEYSPEKADFSFEPDDWKGFVKSLFAVARRKSPEWEYENEVRFILKAPEDGGVLYRIQPEWITRVILGVRASEQFRARVAGVLSRKDMAHVVQDLALLSKDQFKLEFERARPRRF